MPQDLDKKYHTSESASNCTEKFLSCGAESVHVLLLTVFPATIYLEQRVSGVWAFAISAPNSFCQYSSRGQLVSPDRVQKGWA